MITPQARGILSRNICLGDICRQWANLEYQIAHVIWGMLNLNMETGMIVTGGLNIGPRIIMAVALAKHLGHPEATINALVKVQKAINKKLEARRNRAIHGLRFLDADMPDVDIVEMHRGDDKGRSAQTVEELRQLSLDIHALAKGLLADLKASGLFAQLIATNTATSRSDSDSQPGS